MRYDYTSLEKFGKENNILFLDDYSLQNINVFTIISGICKNNNCENIFSKSFRSLVKTNGYCLNCAKEYGKEKSKNLFLEKYGVENPSQCEDIKNKIKQKNLEKYGVEYSSQSKEIKEKTKQTNLKKYGTTCSLHNKDIKEKVKQHGLINMVLIVQIKVKK